MISPGEVLEKSGQGNWALLWYHPYINIQWQETEFSKNQGATHYSSERGKIFTGFKVKKTQDSTNLKHTCPLVSYTRSSSGNVRTLWERYSTIIRPLNINTQRSNGLFSLINLFSGIIHMQINQHFIKPTFLTLISKVGGKNNKQIHF